jgi:hypothetical protein
LNHNGFEDFICWHFTKIWVFSGRSAYHIEWKHRFNGVTCRYLIWGTSLNNLTWKIPWSLDVHTKVKIYIWRVLHGVLHLKAILVNIHIGTSDSCPVCNVDGEDVLYE